MHIKLKNFPSLVVLVVPPSIKKTILNSAPIFNVADLDSSFTPQWSDEYGKHPYNNSVFYKAKGPLLAINRFSVAGTVLPSLLNVNVYKRCINFTATILVTLSTTAWCYAIDNIRKNNKKCDRISFVDGRSISRSVMVYFIIFHTTLGPQLYCL